MFSFSYSTYEIAVVVIHRIKRFLGLELGLKGLELACQGNIGDTLHEEERRGKGAKKIRGTRAKKSGYME